MILKGESKRVHNAFSETNINEQKFRTRVFRLQSTSELPGGGGLIVQSCPALCDPMNCSPPGSSVQSSFQARILEWVAISFSRGSS